MTERPFPKYGSIDNLDKCPEILDQSVTISEKLHGSNHRLMFDDILGEMRYGGRNKEFRGDDIKYDKYGFVDYVNKLPPHTINQIKTYPGFVFYGEFVGKGIQRGIQYRPDNEKEFKVFDIRDPDEIFLSTFQVNTVCEVVGLETVPFIDGGYFTIDTLTSLINKRSPLGIDNKIHDPNNIMEGIVIKPTIPCKNRYGRWMRAKFKSDKWKESKPNTKSPKMVDPKVEILQIQANEFADKVVTEGRLYTIVEHITREGNTTIDMTRTSDFLKEINKDIWDESAKPEDKDAIRIFNKAISNKAMPMWKEYVSKNHRA